MKHKLFNNAWEDFVELIPSEYFDLIVADPPYGKTNQSWDVPWDHASFFSKLLPKLKPTGVILVFGQNPELSEYIIAGIKNYRYDLTWIKSRKNGYVNCNRRPLRQTENIAVFSKGFCNGREPQMNYYPQFIRPCFQSKKQYDAKKQDEIRKNCAGGYAKTKDGIFISQGFKEYPTDIIEVSSLGKCDHPCMKPVELYEYLILTYSRLGDRVFDPAFGSGNSIVAGVGLNRKMFGCEREEKYYNEAAKKLKI